MKYEPKAYKKNKNKNKKKIGGGALQFPKTQNKIFGHEMSKIKK
jgi:hypothetical protein